jgi:hypothetical protein
MSDGMSRGWALIVEDDALVADAMVRLVSAEGVQRCAHAFALVMRRRS